DVHLLRFALDGDEVDVVEPCRVRIHHALQQQGADGEDRGSSTEADATLSRKVFRRFRFFSPACQEAMAAQSASRYSCVLREAVANAARWSDFPESVSSANVSIMATSAGRVEGVETNVTSFRVAIFVL